MKYNYIKVQMANQSASIACFSRWQVMQLVIRRTVAFGVVVAVVFAVVVVVNEDDINVVKDCIKDWKYNIKTCEDKEDQT